MYAKCGFYKTQQTLAMYRAVTSGGGGKGGIAPPSRVRGLWNYIKRLSTATQCSTSRRGPSIGARGGHVPPKPLGGGALGGHRRRAALWCFIRSCNQRCDRVYTKLVDIVYRVSCIVYTRTYTKFYKYTKIHTRNF